MEKKKLYQPTLVEADPPPIFAARLVAADSPRVAYYSIEIFYLPGAGYRIQKSSGASGARPNKENWWRANLKQALEKGEKLVRSKTNTKRRGRVYIDIGAAGLTEQLSQ